MARGKIYQLRRARGLSSMEMAQRLGISQGQYSKLERGVATLSVEMLDQIARVLNVKTAELLPGEEVDHTEHEPYERLASARRQRFPSAKKAAEAFDWDYATYHAHETGRRKLSRLKAVEYGKGFGVSPDWLMLGELSVVRTSPMIPRVGEVAAGVWLERYDNDLDSWDFKQLVLDEEHYVPGDPNFSSEEQFAVVVRGNSMNQVASDGDTLICLKVSTDTEIEDGDIAVVERTQGTTREHTAKRVVIKGRVLELWPESTDPRFQTKLDHEPDSTDSSVRLLGKVIRILKQPPPPKSRVRRG